ncbi:MAG: hypothetical protein ABSG01_10020 [Anaerolineales bacterium]|jgi:hypothetical protein
MSSKLERLLQSKSEIDRAVAEEQKIEERAAADRAAAERRRLEAERQAAKDSDLYDETSVIVNAVKNAAGKSPLDPAALIAIVYLISHGVDEGGSTNLRGGILAIESFFRHLNSLNPKKEK